MRPKRFACQSSNAVVDVSGNRVHLIFARRIGKVVVIVAVIVLGDDVEGRVETEEVAIVIGAEHEGLVELLGLELKTFEALALELWLVVRRPLVLLLQYLPEKAGREPLLLPRSLRKQTPSM
eukprot:6173365-Pleurochrysis_carterae.AAC.1